jgi:hypothetical protein
MVSPLFRARGPMVLHILGSCKTGFQLIKRCKHDRPSWLLAYTEIGTGILRPLLRGSE